MSSHEVVLGIESAPEGYSDTSPVFTVGIRPPLDFDGNNNPDTVTPQERQVEQARFLSAVDIEHGISLHERPDCTEVLFDELDRNPRKKPHKLAKLVKRAIIETYPGSRVTVIRRQVQIVDDRSVFEHLDEARRAQASPAQALAPVY